MLLLRWRGLFLQRLTRWLFDGFFRAPVGADVDGFTKDDVTDGVSWCPAKNRTPSPPPASDSDTRPRGGPALTPPGHVLGERQPAERLVDEISHVRPVRVPTLEAAVGQRLLDGPDLIDGQRANGSGRYLDEGTQNPMQTND